MKSTPSLLILLALSCLLVTPSLAQEKESVNNPNVVKMNLTAIALKNFSFQYERALTNKISGLLGIRFMPKSDLPFKSSVEDLIDDEEAWRYINELKISNFAITPEVRFYMGKNALQGFYIAPFARFASYSVEMPYEYDYADFVDGETEPFPDSPSDKIPLNGKISSITGGILIGSQFKMAKMVYLDLWILGPHYGSSSGDISGKKDLSTLEQEGLRDNLSELEDVPFVESYEVNSTGANVKIKGPWAGVRAGLSIAMRF